MLNNKVISTNDIKLFFCEKRIDPSEILKATQAGYGINNPDKISGYEGTFLFQIPDVYTSPLITQRLSVNPDFRKELFAILDSFRHDDYGFVSSNESGWNGENRYFAGSSSWMIGRYSSRYGGIILETFFDISMIYFVQEDANEVFEQQAIKEMRFYSKDNPRKREWEIGFLHHERGA